MGWKLTKHDCEANAGQLSLPFGKKQALDLGRPGLRNLSLRTICVSKREKKTSTEREFNKRRYTPKSSCDVIYFINVVIKMQIEKRNLIKNDYSKNLKTEFGLVIACVAGVERGRG